MECEKAAAAGAGTRFLFSSWPSFLLVPAGAAAVRPSSSFSGLLPRSDSLSFSRDWPPLLLAALLHPYLCSSRRLKKAASSLARKSLSSRHDHLFLYYQIDKERKNEEDKCHLGDLHYTNTTSDQHPSPHSRALALLPLSVPCCPA